MNKPYKISGLLGVDSYPTHAAAAVIWTLSGVSPLFHVDCAVSLSLLIERLGSGKRTGASASPEGFLYLSPCCPPCASGELELLSLGGHTAGGQGCRSRSQASLAFKSKPSPV